MIATNAGQAAVAVSSAHGVRERGGRSSRVVLSPRRWGQVSRNKFRWTTGANKPGTPGRSRSSRKTIAQGKPGCPGCTCSPCPCASAHGMPVCSGARDLRVPPAPGFPCALRLFRGPRFSAFASHELRRDKRITRAGSRRENAESCPLTLRHSGAPRKRRARNPYPPAVVMDSGPAPRGASRNDERSAV